MIEEEKKQFLDIFFIRRERTGMEKFSGTSYQRTPADSVHYGSL